MTRLFIEDQELDLTEGFSNFITYAIDDLRNLDSKATSFSKTIILPGTANNNQLFGNIFNFNNANFTDNALPNVQYNFNASRQARCRIEVNGLQIIKGILRLLEIIVDGNKIEYECAVFGELGGFVSALANKRLQDLDFSAYDHTYAVSAITGSWDNWNDGEGYYYPLIDYGGVSKVDSNKKDYSFRAFRPALFLKEYMDKIIAGAGYTYESAFFDTNFFNRLIIPNNQKELFIPKQLLFQNNAPTTLINENKSIDSTNQDSEAKVVDVYYHDFTPGYTGGLFTTSDNKEFTYTGSPGIFQFIFWGSLYYSFNAGVGAIRNTILIRMQLEVNGQVKGWNGQTYGRAGSGSSNPSIFFSSISTINIQTNDKIKFRIEVTINRLRAFGNLYSAVTYNIQTNLNPVTVTSQVPVLSPAELGDKIKFTEIMPRNIFQRDFFTSVLKMFNLIVDEDKYKEKHLKIEPYIDYYSNTAIDWSDKLDRNSPIRLKPMSEINARYYQFAYKSDGDFYNDDYRKKYNEGYGDRVFDNALDFAKDTQKVEVIFAATPLVGYQGEEKIVPTIYKLNNAVEERTEHVIRIMQAKKITGVASWKITNGTGETATTLSTNTVYPYAGHLDDPDAPAADINFGVPVRLYFELAAGDLTANLFNAYYSSYFAEITDKDSRTLTAKFRLTEQDIFDLDFAKFVHIDGGYYRISQIVDFNPGANDLTQVELLRVINTEY